MRRFLSIFPENLINYSLEIEKWLDWRNERRYLEFRSRSKIMEILKSNKDSKKESSSRSTKIYLR